MTTSAIGLPPAQLVPSYNLKVEVGKIEANDLRQRTPEWLERKKKTVGGSELATLMGRNPYDKLLGLYKKKIGEIPSEFTSSPATRHGVMFEPIIGHIIELKYKTKIYGQQAFVDNYKGCTDVSYSPDGLAEINGKICLLEFKAPATRQPIPGKIYKAYVPQVKMGLNMIPMATAALYVECVFKYVDLAALTQQLPQQHSLATQTLLPQQHSLATQTMGYIGVVVPYGSKMSFGSTAQVGAIFDLSSNKEMLDMAAKQVEAGQAQYIYTMPTIGPPQISSLMMLASLMGKKLIGTICWRLDAINEVFQEPDANFLDTLLPYIKMFNNIVNCRREQTMTSEVAEQQIAALEKAIAETVKQMRKPVN
jgi:hypothetical protein